MGRGHLMMMMITLLRHTFFFNPFCVIFVPDFYFFVWSLIFKYFAFYARCLLVWPLALLPYNANHHDCYVHHRFT